MYVCMSGWMDGCVYVMYVCSVCVCICMYVCMYVHHSHEIVYFVTHSGIPRVPIVRGATGG